MGGSSGGGGSSSGASDFPTYMKESHDNWLRGTAQPSGDGMNSSIIDLMNAGMSGASPYAAYAPLSINTAFFLSGNTILNYTTPFELLKTYIQYDVDGVYTSYQITYDLDVAFDSYIDDDNAAITSAMAAELALMNDLTNSTIIPAFQQGMADIGAIMSSAFVIGNALIADGKTKQLAQNDAKIRLVRLTDGRNLALSRVEAQKAWKMQNAELAMKHMSIIIDWRKTITSLSGEFARMYVAARHDSDTTAVELSAKDALWDVELYQYGCNVLSAISGAALSKGVSAGKGSSLGGALSGALGGASAGAMLAAPTGGLSIAAGAAIGGAMGIASSFL